MSLRFDANIQDAGKIEEKAIKILRDPQRALLINALCKKHAIDLLFALYLERGGHNEIEQYLSKLGLCISDGSYYQRIRLFIKIGLVKATRIDTKRNYYELTEKGKIVAQHYLKFFERLNLG